MGTEFIFIIVLYIQFILFETNKYASGFIGGSVSIIVGKTIVWAVKWARRFLVASGKGNLQKWLTMARQVHPVSRHGNEISRYISALHRVVHLHKAGTGWSLALEWFNLGIKAGCGNKRFVSLAAAPSLSLSLSIYLSSRIVFSNFVICHLLLCPSFRDLVGREQSFINLPVRMEKETSVCCWLLLFWNLSNFWKKTIIWFLTTRNASKRNETDAET